MEEPFGYIYTLSDKSGIRYVGQTKSPKKRYNAHCSALHNSRNTHLHKWIKSLLTKGERPIMAIVLETNKLDLEEVRIIAECKSKGFNLVNTSLGGKDTKYIYNSKKTAWGKHHSPLQNILLNFRQTIKLFKKLGKTDKVKKIEGYLEFTFALIKRLGKDEINRRLLLKYGN